jgi:diamine N-acetyltransferase
MIRGGCLCGGVRFEIDVATGPFELCHCNRCRKVSGSAFMAGVRVRRADFRWIRGRDLLRSYEAPLLESPPAYRVWFCSVCGSCVPDPQAATDHIEVPAGLLEDDPALRPDKHIFVELGAPWFRIADALPQLDRHALLAYRQARSEPTARPDPAPIADRVSLREITAATVIRVVRLAVTEYQNRFVATNAVSLSQALFAAEAWYRAIHLGEEPVGFVMLSDESLLEPPPEQPKIGVWRFMVDAKHQGKGIGRRAMGLVIEHARSRGFAKLSLSYVPGEGGPEPLYRSMGFRPTGEMDDDEVVMELSLDRPG